MEMARKKGCQGLGCSSLRIEQFRLKGTFGSHPVQPLYHLYCDRNWSLNVNNRLG